MTGSFPTLEDAFQAFRSEPVERLRVKLRRVRAAQILALAAAPEGITVDRFNRDIWVLESSTRVDGAEVPKGWLIDTGSNLTAEHAADLDCAIDEGRVELHGNYSWKAGSGVYSPGKDEPTRLSNAQAALRLLANTDLSPVDKAQRIDDLHGFGDCAATGLVMLAHPTEFAIYNGPSSDAVRSLGLPADTSAVFQSSARQLRDRLGAEDFCRTGLVPVSPQSAGHID